MPELLTMKQIAKRFQVHKATIYRWIKANEFPKPAVKKRGTYRWDADEINKVVGIVRNR